MNKTTKVLSVIQNNEFQSPNNITALQKRIADLEATNMNLILTEKKLIQLGLYQQIIRNINKYILTIKNEPILLQQICNELKIAEECKYVWIGLIDANTHSLQIVAQAGIEKSYFTPENINEQELIYQNDLINSVIKTGQSVIIRDIANTSSYNFLQKHALEHGYSSSITLPLLQYGGDVPVPIGVLNLCLIQPHDFNKDEIDFLKEVTRDIIIGINNIRTELKFKKALEHVRSALNESITAIAKVGEIRDPYTAGHEKRVSKLATAIAQGCKLPERQIEGIRVTSNIHDIGKMVVPAEILSKPMRLTPVEFDMVKTHAQVGYNILSGLNFPWPVAETILQHHERLNGTGYPQGLKGNDILLEARILAVADVVEAMSSHRPYRPAFDTYEALKEITSNKGILYDSDITDVCCHLFIEKRFNFDK
ncbi:MAG: HD domain-containing phosphohydrolase [bacterium]